MCGNGHCDSPEALAKVCTYTLIGMETNSIVQCVNVLTEVRLVVQCTTIV